MKGTGLKAGLAAGVLLSAIVAVAGPDTFFLGLGSNGLTVPSAQNQPTEVQVNTYAPVTAITTTTEGRPRLMLGNLRQGNVASNFANNRLVMVLQTTGITPTEVPDESFEQDTLELGNSAVGRWELGTITDFNSTTGALVLSQPLKYSYAPDATQVILVPEYTSVTVADGARIEALPWDGASGGVVAFLAQEGIQLNGTGVISAASAGFRGGVFTREEGGPAEGCEPTDDEAGDFRLGARGEGLSTTRYTGAGALRGRRNFTHGGGGGVCKQSGGGGGGNAGMGGVGGMSMDGSRSVGGLGGTSLSYSPLDHLTFGGGGGSGQGHTATAPAPNGGRGGGIVFLRAASLSGGRVDASGASAAESPDSGGGGGAGGSISVRLTGTCSTTAIVANGGNGGDVDSVQSGTVNAAGPGGGGGGGRVLLQAGASSTCPISVDSGVAGLTSDDGEDPVAQGAMPPESSIRLPPYVGSVTFLVGGMPVEIAAPTLSIANALVKTSSPLVTGTGAPGAGLLIYRNRPGQASVQEFVVRTVIGANGTYAVNVPLQEGNNTLKAAVERQGLQGSDSTDLSVRVDTLPPDTRASTSLSFPTNADEITFTVEGDEANGQRCDNAATRPCTLECRLTRPSQATPAFSPCTSVSSHDISAASGTYRFEARAIDAATNEDPTPAVIEFVVDHDSPDVSIRSTNPAPPVSVSKLSMAAFGFDSNASDLDRFECRLSVVVPPEEDPEHGAWATCPANHALSGLLHGHHYTLAVRAVDRAGNQSPVDTHSWTVDLVAPDTEFTAENELPEVTSQNVPFAFGSDDTDVVRFECSLDAAPFATCTSPFTPGTPPADGTHTLQVRAVDEAGNVDPTPAIHTWVVDTDGPPATIRLGPPDPSNQATAGFDFDSTATDVVRFECQLEEVPATGSSTTGTWATCPASKLYSNLTHGSRYTLSVRAVDRADNSGTEDMHSWTVDLVAPDTEFTAENELPEVTSQNVPFAFGSDDTDVVRFECSLDAAPFATCTSPFTPGTPPADGTHTLQVRAVDEAGNVDPTPAIHTWVVDTATPDTAISLTSPVPPRNPNNSRSAAFGFTSSATDVVRFECRLDTTEPESTTGTWQPCPSAHVINDLVNGTTYRLHVRAVDRAGNSDASPASHLWRVDVTPPNTVFTQAPAELTSDLVARFGFASPQDSDVDYYECSLDGDPFGRCVSVVEFQVDDGVHKMLIRAVDTAGNVDDTPATHVWRVDSGPVITEIRARPPHLTNESVARFVFTSNKGHVAFRCKLDDQAEVDCGSITPDPEDRETEHPFNVLDGRHTVNVHAVDQDNGDRDETGASYTWSVDTVAPGPPLITEPMTAYVNTTTPVIRGTAPEAGTVTVYLGALNVGQSATSGTLSWSLSGLQLEERQYTLRATLTDPASNTGSLGASEPRVFTVDVTPPDTVITGMPPARGRERTVTFDFEHQQEVNFAGFQCSLNDEQYRDCTPPYEVTVPQDGTYVLSVRARDLAGNLDLTPATHTWLVDSKRPETSIINKPDVFDHSSRSVFLFGSDEEAVRYECSLNGAAFAPCDNPVTLPPLSEVAHTLQVRAVDSVENVDDTPESYTWTVDDTPPAVPSLSFPTPGALVETRTPQFRGTALGGASEVVIRVDGDERGRASVDGAGQWRFTLTGSLPDGEHSVSVYAVDLARNQSTASELVTFTLIPSTEVDSRGGGLSCSLGGSGQAPLASLGLVAFALLAARRRRQQ